jgi:hypothetical protein
MPTPNLALPQFTTSTVFNLATYNSVIDALDTNGAPKASTKASQDKLDKIEAELSTATDVVASINNMVTTLKGRSDAIVATVGAPLTNSSSYTAISDFVNEQKTNLANHLTAKGQQSNASEPLASLVNRVANINLAPQLFESQSQIGMKNLLPHPDSFTQYAINLSSGSMEVARAGNYTAVVSLSSTVNNVFLYSGETRNWTQVWAVNTYDNITDVAVSDDGYVFLTHNFGNLPTDYTSERPSVTCLYNAAVVWKSWDNPVGSKIVFNPANNTVTVAYNNALAGYTALRTFSKLTGSVVRSYPTSASDPQLGLDYATDLAVSSSGIVYCVFGATSPKLCRIDLDGTKKWQVPFINDQRADQIVADGENVYVTQGNPAGPVYLSRYSSMGDRDYRKEIGSMASSIKLVIDKSKNLYHLTNKGIFMINVVGEVWETPPNCPWNNLTGLSDIAVGEDYLITGSSNGQYGFTYGPRYTIV